jgi:tetratricopeptide (TPR) repeat protein
MKKAALLLLMGIASLACLAQTSSRNAEMKLDADYYMMLKDYPRALDLYLKILRTEAENADIKHRIGICYLNSESEKARAIPYLEEAVQKVSAKYNPNSLKEENASFEAYFALGSAYRVNNELDKAIEAYTRFKEYLDKNDDYNIRVADQYIRNCQLAREMQQKPVGFSAINLGNLINNEKANFNAVVSDDGTMLVYTSPGRQGYEIFQAVYTDSGWAAPKNITTVLGTGKFMKTCDLSADGKILLLALEDPENSDIYRSVYNKGRWSKVEALGKTINTKGQETHASLSADGNTLYFTSNRKGGEGDLDIYRSSLNSKGEWGKPENLGRGVNTAFNEETPFVTDDGKYLYFSSEGHDGIGGYDVYRVELGRIGSGAVNLGYPVNTTDNNLFYYPTGDGLSGYYAFAGDDSYGGRDVYAVSVIPDAPAAAEQPVAVVVEEPPVAEVTTVAEAEPVKETEAEQPVTAINTEQPAEAVAELPAVVAEDPVPELVVEEPIPTTPATISTPITSSYTVQIMALRKPVDFARFSVQDVCVDYNADQWYRYSVGNTTDQQEAERLLAAMVEKGYRDAFIRRKGIVPRYTIQVMAVPGPLGNLAAFENLSGISVTKGEDNFCRYTTGAFETREAALSDLERVRGLGYTGAFVCPFKTPQ